MPRWLVRTLPVRPRRHWNGGGGRAGGSDLEVVESRKKIADFYVKHSDGDD